MKAGDTYRINYYQACKNPVKYISCKCLFVLRITYIQHTRRKGKTMAKIIRIGPLGGNMAAMLIWILIGTGLSESSYQAQRTPQEEVSKASKEQQNPQEPVNLQDNSEDLKVLPEQVFGVELHDMMKKYLTDQIDKSTENWRQNFEKLKTKNQIKARQKRLRKKFLDALGEFPERTPLKVRLTGVLKRQDYRVEKLLDESQPKHYVSAICFVPQSDKYAPPYPSVLVPCGHSQNGKAHQSYQTMGALLALNGMVSLVFDPVEQGERMQVIAEKGQFKWWGVHAHNRIGVSSIFLGRNTATFEIWDGMRGIDYLQSRGDVDPDRIGCTGNSGGGTQTSYLMVLDDRIDVAAPSCYVTSFDRLVHTIGGQDAEQNIYAQLAFGMDHADYLTMRAPSPVLIAAGIRDFFDIKGTRDSFGYAKQLFEKLDAPDNIALFENDAGHNYNRQQRQAIVTWFNRFLRGQGEAVSEPNIITFSGEQLQCTPQGQVMLLENARSVYDINADYAKELSQKRKALWEKTPKKELLAQIRDLAGIRILNDLPDPRVEAAGTLERQGYTIEKLVVHPEPGIALAAVRFIPEVQLNKPPILYLHQEGKAEHACTDGPIEKLVRSGQIVLAVDVRGTGEARQVEQGYFFPEYGRDGRDLIYAYLLGRSYVGMRTEDILICARYMTKNERHNSKRVKMIAVGNVGVPALHAAVLEPNLFFKVEISQMVTSWTDVVR